MKDFLSYPASIIDSWRQSLAQSPLDGDQETVLLRGNAWVHDMANAYYGEPRAICALGQKGLMRIETWHEGIWHHVLTPAGERERNRLRRSRFPEMGIREIYPEAP